jgi:antitoxin component of MazEF toxin-antitoxin module
MPIKRKICKVGTGLAVFLPKSWVQLLEEKYGKINAVTIEVNNVLTIAPILPKKKEAPKREQQTS